VPTTRMGSRTTALANNLRVLYVQPRKRLRGIGGDFAVRRPYRLPGGRATRRRQNRPREKSDPKPKPAARRLLWSRDEPPGGDRIFKLACCDSSPNATRCGGNVRDSGSWRTIQALISSLAVGGASVRHGSRATLAVFLVGGRDDASRCNGFGTLGKDEPSATRIFGPRSQPSSGPRRRTATARC